MSPSCFSFSNVSASVFMLPFWVFFDSLSASTLVTSFGDAMLNFSFDSASIFFLFFPS